MCTALWCVRRISLLRMTRLDFQECMNCPVFIVRANGEVLSYRNALRTADKKVVGEMYNADKNIFDWVDEASRRQLRQAIDTLMRTRERQQLKLTFLNSLGRNEVSLIWYGPRSFAFVIDMPSISLYEMEHLRSEASLLGTILDNLPIATTVKDVRNIHRYVIVNRYAAELCDIARESMLSHGMSVMPAKVQELLDASDQETLARGYSEKVFRKTLDNGESHSYKIRKVLVNGANGKPAWIVSSALDVSDLVQQQQIIDNSQRQLSEARLKVEESNRLKEEFLRNISHEMRTPLNAIVGFSSLLRETEDGQQRNELAQIISNNCDVLLTQLDDMLQISKIQSGNISLHPRETDLHVLVEECVAEGNWLEKPQLSYNLQLPPTPYRAMLDRRQVRVVLRQIISNAIKFTDKGHIDVGYQVLPDSVQFYVKDTGIGIAPEHCESVFNRFEKAGSLRPGVGLGLTICRALVELMSGEIHLESTLGQGTDVVITLPTTAKEVPADESFTISRLWDQMMTIRTTRGSI